MEGNTIDNLNRLLNLESHHLEVWRIPCGQIAVSYANCEIKDGITLMGIFGTGNNFYEAIDDYIRQISGKTLVFNACTDQRKEVIVL